MKAAGFQQEPIPGRELAANLLFRLAVVVGEKSSSDGRESLQLEVGRHRSLVQHVAPGKKGPAETGAL